jgi:hypothetical protein
MRFKPKHKMLAMSCSRQNMQEQASDTSAWARRRTEVLLLSEVLEDKASKEQH